jgi:hypothetical protein
MNKISLVIGTFERLWWLFTIFGVWGYLAYINDQHARKTAR